jgi:phosphatidylinositol alpha 1,6-mannosyltransferase
MSTQGSRLFFTGSAYAAAGAAAARALDVPSVAVYQTDVAGFARRNRLGAGAAFAWQIIRMIHNSADRTLAPSSAAIDDLRTAGVKRVRLWTRGVDLDGFHPDNRQGPAGANLRRHIAPNGETIVGYSGGFGAFDGAYCERSGGCACCSESEGCDFAHLADG